MQSPLFKRISSALVAIALISGTFAGGAYFGSQKSLAQAKNGADLTTFWRVWETLDEKYVATKDKPAPTDQEKVWGAIQGLAAAYGDPYTVFFPPQESKDFQDEISGAFEGVGMEVGIKENVLTVIAPIKNTPAFKAGIKAGDQILKIDDKVTLGMTVDEAVKLMRGKKGTKVTLTILTKTDQQPREVVIIRDAITVPSIDTELRSDGIFVIRLSNFNANSSQQFRNALKEFVNSKSDKLILDLRGNPGGYLEASVDMASWFLPKNAVIVKEDTKGKGTDPVYKSYGYNVFNKNLKMVVLVDGGSASASEILAGALQEHGIATLVGTKTYGKGSVQELVQLPGDTSLKITIARWLTPNGVSISDNGLTPNVEVVPTKEDQEKLIDVQLNKAVEILLKK